VARFTPWDCSKAAAAISLAAVVAAAPQARAELRWSQAVFPVSRFAGYTSHFGQRLGPGGALEPHHGIDIAAPLGSPIRNWWSGAVKELINDTACGVGLLIQSGSYEHLYCHLAGTVQGGTYRSGSVALQPGMRLRGGALIGHVGVSGRSTGPHLHWAVRYGDHWINPALILRAMAAARSRPQGSPIPRART
jgi:murein DD-endopeptidase MepM/ murein hydrolase activator NlpD